MKPTETVDFHIKLLWHSIANLYNQIAQEFELTQATGFVLLHIDNKLGTPATKIAPLMGMRATSLSRILKKMEEELLIYRKKDKKDGRLVKIHLTDKGKEKRDIAKKVVRDFNQFIIDRMKPEQLENYFKCVEFINNATEEYKIIKFGGNG